MKKSVKANYASCESLLLSATNAYICTAFMEWAGLGSLGGTPKEIKVPGPRSSTKQREQFVDNVLSKFVEEFILVEFDSEKSATKKQKETEMATSPEDKPEVGVPHHSTREDNWNITSGKF